MSVRACDIAGHLRMKQKMVESDHDAIFSDGRRLPIFIYARPNAETEHVVEIENRFYRAKLLPGFVRLELTPEGKRQREAEAAEALKAQEEKPKNFAELHAHSQQAAAQAISEQYARRRQQQGIVSNHPLTEANRQFAAIAAASKGQSR